MKIITLHMIRDTLGFKGPMELIELASELECCILKVWEATDRAVKAGLIIEMAGIYSTTWRG